MPKGFPKNGINRGWFKKGIKLSKGEKIRLSNLAKERGYGRWMNGKKHTEKTKIKMSLIKKGKIPKNISMIAGWNKGKKISAEECFKDSERIKRAYREGKILGFQKGHKLYNKFRDTSIELKIEVELKKRNINYQKQFWINRIANVDFLLENKIIIQCDGGYWHNLPDNKERDIRQDKILKENGYQIFRFWEHEINKSAENCINIILNHQTPMNCHYIQGQVHLNIT